MSHLQATKPNVYCLRMGKPFAITPQQYDAWFTDNQSAKVISKSEYLEAREFQLQKGKTICLSTYCNTPLTNHNHGYCDTCEDFNQLEYDTNEPN